MKFFLKYKFSFLILFLSFTSLAAVWYFFYSSKALFPRNDTKVLGAAQVSLNRIDEYDIEFTDLDGQLKSIRPTSCLGFDIPGKSGVASSMKLVCTRQYKVEFPTAEKYGTGARDNGWMYVIRGKTYGVAIKIYTGIGTFNKDINIFNSTVRSYFPNMSVSVPKYRPMLKSFSGRPVMFYYGGIHEINLSKDSTYLLTRFYDSTYFTGGPIVGNIPNSVYKLSSSERFFFVSPTNHGVAEESCFTCSQKSIDAQTCNVAGLNGPYCPGLAGEINIGNGKFSPDLVRAGYMKGSYLNEWQDAYAAWSFRGNRTNYTDPNIKPRTRYMNWPFIDSVQLVDCGNNNCSNPTNNGRLYVEAKYSSELPYSKGYGVPYKLNCIGKDNNGGCAEVVMTGGRRDTSTQTPMSISAYRYYHSLGSSMSNCNNFTSSTACYTNRELLVDDRWSPFTNLNGGFEVPYLQYDMFNTKDCQLTGQSSGRTNCVKSVDWYSSTNNITYFSSYINPRNSFSALVRVPNFPPSNVDYYFANNSSHFAIKMNPSSNTMDIYRFWLRGSPGSATPVSKKYTYRFSAGSPMPNFYRKDEISIAFNSKSNDIDILFSSMNAPSNYGSSDLRILRLVNGNLSVNEYDPVYNRSLTAFNSSQALVDSSYIVDITDKFNFGGAYPLTFEKYYESGDDNSGYPIGSEYFVFVTRDSVYHSLVPKTSECYLNLSSLNIINTHPNSLYYGLDLKAALSSTYRLSIQSSKPIYCNTQDGVAMTDLPITAAQITFYDPISNSKLASFNSTLIENYSTLRFGGAINSYLDSFGDGKKLNFDLNFSMGGTNILVSKQNFPTLFSKDYSVYTESKLQLGLSQAGVSVNLATTPINVSVKKNLGTAINLSFSGKSNPVTLDSSNFSNLFYDHNLRSIFTPTTNTSSKISRIIKPWLEDSVTYQICFNFKVLSLRFNPNSVSATINNLNPRCIDVKYRNLNATSYVVNPQKITVNLASIVTASVGNFEFNGNVFSSTQLPDNFLFKNNDKKYEGNYISSGNFSSNLKFLNNAFFGMYRPSALPTSLVNFDRLVDFSSSSNFKKFNLMYESTNIEEPNPINSSSFKVLNPVSPSSNDIEIVAVSKGVGVMIDLTNENILKNFDKYILINLDESRDSRITFKVDCSDDRYSSICLFDNKFNFKGALLGSFSLSGNVDSSIANTKFVRIHENADTLIKLSSYLKSKKYQIITSSLVNLKYD